MPMSNHLPKQKQLAVLNALVEGCSVRSTSRMTDVSIPTILALLLRVGDGCQRLHDKLVRALACERIECDEIWAFIWKKQRHLKVGDPGTWGDVWTWTGIDAASKIIAAYRVGKRDGENADAFIADLNSRLINKVQIDTDGLSAYADAIEKATGGVVDYAQVIKEYEADPIGAGRYSPPKVKSIEKIAVMGNPDLDVASTSYVERQNLTMRMSIRRMTRLTNAFSKKIENHRAATALHFAHYNFVRRHQTLRVTPAMAAGVTQTMWSMEQLLDTALACAAEQA